MDNKALKNLFCGAVLALLCSTASANAFPTPTGMSGNVHFWLRVYSEWPTNRYAIHDDQRLDIVYQVIAANDGREPKVKNAKSDVEAALARLDAKRPASEHGLSGIDLEVYRAWASSKDPQRFALARGHVRHQKGQADRFAQALKVSGRYRSQIEAILTEHGLPKELLAVVFVESMFQTNARSFSGALGIWQFMRATGKEYLNINDVVDERQDPILASYAAASYLRSAYKRLKAWPVAITSYNYGMNGMARAITATGSTDLANIFDNYRSGRMGFAAKNYYCEFLAALKVLREPKRYFPNVQPYSPWTYDVVRLPAPTTAPALIKARVLAKDELQFFNPSLSRQALAGSVSLPQGMSLRLPRGNGQKFIAAFARIPASQRRQQNIRDKTHTVQRGETVIGIARRYGVGTGQVLAANHLARDRADSIQPGMTLRIPGKRSTTSLLPEAKHMPVPELPAGTAIAAASEAEPEAVAVKNTTVQKDPTQKSTKSTAAASRNRQRQELEQKLAMPTVRSARVGRGRAVVVAGPAIPIEVPFALEDEIAVDVVVGSLALPKIDVLLGEALTPVAASEVHQDVGA